MLFSFRRRLLSPSHGMSGLTKLGFALILLLSLSLLGLVAELLYLLHCRRRGRCLRPRPTADPELAAPSHGPSPRELLLHVLRFKHRRSRVEPTGSAPVPLVPAPAAPPKPPAAAAEPEEDCDLAQWRAMCLGPSRALYTINEGDEEEGEETPFATPCESLRFYTPSPSPPRASAEAGGGRAGALPPAVERR